MTDKPNYSLKDLLNELKEKEKEVNLLIKNGGCVDCKLMYGSWFLCNDCKELNLRLEAEISALKKGISACEEILNSQQNTSTEEVGLRKPEMTPSADTQTLIKQALSKRNKEILEWLDNYSKENGEWYKYYVRIKDLKKQLTTTEDEEE
jgi:hypothetical protein